MAAKKPKTFNEFFTQVDSNDPKKSKVRKKMNKKSPKGRWYGGAIEAGPASDAGAAVGEVLNRPDQDLIQEILAGAGRSIGREYINSSQYHHEEDEATGDKVDQSRRIFQMMFRRKGIDRQGVIDEIKRQTGVTDSTAVSYYQRFAKEAGIAGQSDQDIGDDAVNMGNVDPSGIHGKEDEVDPDQDLPPEELGNDEPVIRTVQGAHLIKKEQTGDGKFEELWIYNVSKDMSQSVKVRRDILAGTDIGRNKTSSDDGDQTYSLTTLGNAQIMHIKGLPN